MTGEVLWPLLDISFPNIIDYTDPERSDGGDDACA